MKVLFITETNPFPPTGGEKIRSYNIIKSLLDSGIEVHLVQKAVEGSEWANFSSNLKVYSYDKRFENGLLSVLFLIFKRRKLGRLINNLITDIKFHHIFLDYYLIGNYIRFFKKKSHKVIYSSHNVESLLTKQRPYQSLFEKWKVYFLNKVQYFHEKRYLKEADFLITVSIKDKIFYSKFIPVDRIKVIPNFVDTDLYQFTEEKKNYVLFPGNFNAYQNIEGIKWFLKNVWDEYFMQNTELYVVGNNAKNIKFIIDSSLVTSVRFIEGGDNMIKYFEEAKVMIVPILHGSGSRIKILESMACGTQIISTTKGAEGINHANSILIADDPDQFRSHLIESLKIIDRTRITTAFDIVTQNYSLSANSEKIVNLLK